MLYLTKMILFNLLFGFLIFGTSYVYFNSKITEKARFYMISAKFFLFVLFLTLVYFFQSSSSNFKMISPPLKVPEYILQYPNFKLEMKLKDGSLVNLEDKFFEPPAVTTFCSKNLNEIAMMTRTVIERSKLRTVYISFVHLERDYKQKSLHILQGIKNDLLALNSNAPTMVMIHDMHAEVIKKDFLDLLKILHGDNQNLYFVVFESNSDICQAIKGNLKS
jgi:hypothetical protein